MTNEDNYVIRPASPGDVDCWYELLVMSSPELETVFGEQALKAMFTKGNNLFGHDLVYFADTGGAPASMLLGYDWKTKKRLDPPTGIQVVKNLGFDIFKKIPIMLSCFGNIGVVNTYEYFISNFAVYPKFRGTGLADLMFDESRKRACECGATYISLEAAKGNELAIAFYRRHGFVITREINYHIGLEKKTVYRMLKTL